jgi:hypothetical protein
MKAPAEEHFFSKPKTKKYLLAIIHALVPGLRTTCAFAASALARDRIVQTGKAE